MIRFILLLPIILLTACAPGPSPLDPDPGVDIMSIPPFTLTDHTGAQRTDAIFRRPGLTVLDFTFTSCPFICPIMNTNMLRVQRELAGRPLNIVSISVDPERDTPEALAAHAAAIGADTANWTFLTGDFHTIETICRDGLKLSIGGHDERTIDLADGSTMNNIPHSPRFILIRSDGQPIGLYTGTDEHDVSRLIARIKAALERR